MIGLHLSSRARADEDEVKASLGASSKGTKHLNAILDVVSHPYNVTLPHEQLE